MARYAEIIVRRPRPGVSSITLDRPGALNALRTRLLEALRRAFTNLFATEDRKECIAAFIEKRKARFVGR